jgi:hypothetical protein
MVRTWLLVALAACGSSASPPPVAPRGPTPCARASDNMVQALLDRLAREDPVPTEEADALRNLIRERCEQDRWSAEATGCLIAMKQVADAEACAPLLSEAQQAALVRDQSAHLGAKGAAPASGAPAAREGEAPPAQPESQPPTAAPAPPPATGAGPAPAALPPAPPKPLKAKDKPRPGDPDDGGE